MDSSASSWCRVARDERQRRRAAVAIARPAAAAREDTAAELADTESWGRNLQVAATVLVMGIVRDYAKLLS